MRTSNWAALVFLVASCDQSGAAQDPTETNIEADGVLLSYPLGVPYWTRETTVKTAAGGTILDTGVDVVSDPGVLYDAGKYRMWFTHGVIDSLDPYTGHPEIGYTESTDRITWTPPTLNVLGTSPNTWDAVGIETANVVRDPYDPAALIMYYTGDRVSYDGVYAGIGAAYSQDNGASWTKHPTPVLTEQNPWEMPLYLDLDDNPNTPNSIIGGVMEPSVLYENGGFKMWYAGIGMLNNVWGYRIGYATSADGLTWSRHANPVLVPGPAGSWDDALVSHVNVVKTADNIYRMFYFGSSKADEDYCAAIGGCQQTPGSIGMATSTNGITWVKDANNPILLPNPNGSFDDHAVGGPSALEVAGQLYLWYMGDGNPSALNLRIGISKVGGRSQIGEARRITLGSADGWKLITLSRTYTNPVVIVGASSQCDTGEPPIFRIKELTAASFKIKLDEWAHLDDIHCSETVDYLVVEAGNHLLVDGRRLIAKKLSVGTQSWVSSSFGFTFASAPAVFSQAQSYADAAEVITRQQSRTTTGVQVKLQEAQGADGIHANETLGYVALSTGSGDYNSTTPGLEVVCPTPNLTHTLTQYNFNKYFFGTSAPLIFGAMQTTNDTNPAIVRRSALTNTYVKLQAAEEKSAETDITHSPEVGCYLSIDYWGTAVPIYKQQ